LLDLEIKLLHTFGDPVQKEATLSRNWQWRHFASHETHFADPH
jgi:hypothetical protein